jgi:beta-glucosidase
MMAKKARWTAVCCAIGSIALVACAPEELSFSPDDEQANDEEAGSLERDLGRHRDDDFQCRSIPNAPTYADWPRIQSRIRRDDDQERFIARLVDAMTLEQKVGQMTQLELLALRDSATGVYDFGPITELSLGSILTGGSSWPNADKHASLDDWLELADAVWEASPVVRVRGRHGRMENIRIPTFWGIDAVHGAHAAFGSTVFPHNIGIGATRDTCLAREMGDSTTKAVRAMGLDMTFGPCLATVQDDRWGRTYEGFSEEPSVVRALGKAMNEGVLFGDDSDRHGRRVTSFPGIFTNAKHYIADGGSTRGIDQGIVPVDESELINTHGQGYFGAFEAGAPVVMVGFFGWQDRGENIADEYLINQVLKNKIGFDGMVLSDWNAISFVPGCANDHCPQAVNAGVDMFMVPFDYRAFVTNTVADVREGRISMSRINDAVTRILRTKLRGGLFDLPKPSRRHLAGDQDAITDRPLARRAVRESLVLLKNNDRVLPLRRDQKILVVGKSADSIMNQTGGWTLTWQGGPAPFAPNDVNLNSDFPAGQSILAGIQETVGAGNVTFSADGSGVDVTDFDAVIAVVGEFPYSEFFGDVATADGNWRDPNNLAKRTLEHGIRYPEDRAVIEAVSGQGVPVVTVLMSGRVLFMNKEINLSDAFVAAWLPGTEGKGVADVLFRDRRGRVNFDFTGKLPYSWPRSACQTTVNVGDADYNPQFAFGYGLTYRSSTQVGQLDDTAGPAEGCSN